jgi:beta-galactosidase
MIRESFNTNWFICKDDGKNNMRPVGPITLPHDAMLSEERIPDGGTGHAGGYFPGGVYVYEKNFELPQDAKEKTILLEFEGVYQRSQVYINGKEAGGWPYGYSRFYVNTAPFLVYGAPNHVKVVVDNSDVPNSRWYSGSGIYRNVNLMIGRKVHIRPNGVRITTLSIDEPVKIQVETRLANEANLKCQIQIEILDGKEVVAAYSGKETAVIEIPGAKLWSDVSPNLYSCRATLIKDGEVLDETVDTFGIRSIECTPQKGLLINGQPTKLRGACVHHDNGVLGAATFEAAEERRLWILKDAGYNAIRSSHNPLSIAMLDACDRYGMYVMDELADTWWIPKNPGDFSKEFLDWWERDLASMVDKDFNHPSVIMYSVGNEISETALANGIEFSKVITAKARELDRTRLITIGINLQLNQMNYQGRNHYKESGDEKKAKDITTSAYINTIMNVMKPFDPIFLTRKSVDLATRDAFKYFDVAGYNYGAVRYVMDGKLHPERIILGSETYPSDIYDNWQLVEKLPYLIGDFQWAGWDYLGEAGCGMWQYGEKKGALFKDYPCILADTGMIDITGYVTARAWYNKFVWGLEKKPYIGVRPVNHSGERPSKSVWRNTDAIASWSWAGCEGKTAVVEVYSDADSVELLLNGRSLGKKIMKKLKALFKTKFIPGNLEAIAYDVAGKELSRSQLKSAAESTQLNITMDRTVLQANGRDLVFLSIEITDDHGIVKVLEDTKVFIKVEGAGTLQGFGSARPFTEENFTDSEHFTYYGRALAVVRAGQHTGTIKVSISAGNCETIILSIPVEEPFN